MTQPETSDSGLVTTHTPFRNSGGLTVRCSCGWGVEVQRQNAATSKAKRHIDAYPDHEVVTTRTQIKVTYSRKRVR